MVLLSPFNPFITLKQTIKLRRMITSVLIALIKRPKELTLYKKSVVIIRLIKITCIYYDVTLTPLIKMSGSVLVLS